MIGERIRIPRPNGAGNEPVELRGVVVWTPVAAAELGQVNGAGGYCYWVRLDADAPDHPARWFLADMLVPLGAVERLAELDDEPSDRDTHPVSRAR